MSDDPKVSMDDIINDLSYLIYRLQSESPDHAMNTVIANRLMENEKEVSDKLDLEMGNLIRYDAGGTLYTKDGKVAPKKRKLKMLTNAVLNSSDLALSSAINIMKSIIDK